MGKHIRNKDTGSRPHSHDDERVKRAAARLRELQASGVALSEILSGEAGAAFIREECDGDLDVATAAFALVYPPTGRDDGG